MPARQTSGSMSVWRPQRKATAKPANPSTAMIATMLPRRAPAPMPPPTMTATPATANAMAIHVARRTRSPSTTQASGAVMKGDALRMNTAFATVVWTNEKMNPVKATPRQSPPTTAPGPALANSVKTAPRWRTASTANSVIDRVIERTRRICHGPAASIARTSMPPRLKKQPATMTRTMPRA